MDIRDTVTSMLGSSPDGMAVRRFVEETHRLAHAYLRQRARVGALEARRFGLSLEDLALDCVADLFQRDEDGRFVQLVEYFESANWQSKDLVGLRIALRRLVFSKVNEGLFRRHRGHDPELARIIRNVKNAVKSAEGLSLVRRGKALWMVVGDPALLGERPPLPFETVEAHLVPRLNGTCHTPELVALFEELVGAWPGYDAGYPVSRFAMAVRSASMRLAMIPEVESPPTFGDAVLTSEMVEHVIEETIEQVGEAMFDTYVASGKIDAALYQAYMRATYRVLSAQFCSKAMPVDSYYHALEPCLPGLAKEEYRQAHRHVMEYLVKTARARLMKELEKEMTLRGD